MMRMPFLIHREVTKNCDDVERLYRPWGENFVQSLYNEVEAMLPLIDNLVAESTGVKIFGIFRPEGKQLSDVARFLVFNLFQTSLRQKLGVLEVKKEVTILDKQQLAFCKNCLKEDLMTYSLPPGDSVRVLLEQARDDASINKEGSELRLRFRAYVENLKLDDPQLRVLCERAWLTSKSLKASPDMAEVENCSRPLGTIVNKIFDPEGSAILRNRLSTIKESFPD